jgi:hypothetical protein
MDDISWEHRERKKFWTFSQKNPAVPSRNALDFYLAKPKKDKPEITAQ